MDKLFSEAFAKLDCNGDGKITQEDIETLLSKIEPKIKSVLGESNDTVNKAFESFRKAIDHVKAKDGTISKEDAEAQFKKLMEKLQQNDFVKAILPYTYKAVFGAMVGVAAHRISEDKLVGFGVGLLHVTSTIMFEKGVFSKESVESLRAMSKEDITKMLDQDGNNKITPNDFAILFEKQYKAMKEERPDSGLLGNIAVAAASFAIGFVFLHKYIKA